MVKKIGSFLMIMLAICAVLLLNATANRAPQTETTQPTVQTTTPENTPSEPLLETENVPVETQSTDQTRGLVAQILDRKELVTTETTRLVTANDLLADPDTAGLSGISHGRALARELEVRAVNPIAAHWELVYEGLYEMQRDESGRLAVAGIGIPEYETYTYEYTEGGAQQMISDLLNLAARMDDGLELERALLGANVEVDEEQVFYSQEDQCRYAYFACTCDRSTYILCIYLRGEAKIEDVEFQLLTLRHASGTPEALAELDYRAKKQAAALMTAAELLLTGQTRAGEGNVPFTYDLGDWSATVGRFTFTGDPDWGSLINYRLKK